MDETKITEAHTSKTINPNRDNVRKEIFNDIIRLVCRKKGLNDRKELNDFLEKKHITVNVKMGILTPIEVLAQNGNTDAVLLLIEYGGDINAAVRGAEARNHHELADLLLEKGASFNLALEGAAQASIEGKFLVKRNSRLERIKTLLRRAKEIGETAEIKFVVLGAEQMNDPDFINFLTKGKSGVEDIVGAKSLKRAALRSSSVKGAARKGKLSRVTELLHEVITSNDIGTKKNFKAHSVEITTEQGGNQVKLSARKIRNVAEMLENLIAAVEGATQGLQLELVKSLMSNEIWRQANIVYETNTMYMMRTVCENLDGTNNDIFNYIFNLIQQKNPEERGTILDIMLASLLEGNHPDLVISTYKQIPTPTRKTTIRLAKQAIVSKNIAIIEPLLVDEKQPNSRNAPILTENCVCFAANMGDKESIDFLLNHGADSTLAIYYAAKYRQFGFVTHIYLQYTSPEFCALSLFPFIFDDSSNDEFAHLCPSDLESSPKMKKDRAVLFKHSNDGFKITYLDKQTNRFVTISIDDTHPELRGICEQGYKTLMQPPTQFRVQSKAYSDYVQPSVYDFISSKNGYTPSNAYSFSVNLAFLLFCPF